MKLELLLSVLLSGCTLSPTLVEAAKARGAADLNCARERVSVDDSSGNVLVVRGCGVWTQYTCFYTASRNSGRFSSGTAVCVTDAAAQVLPDTNLEPIDPDDVVRSHESTNGGVSKHGNMCIGQGCSDTAPSAPR